MVQILDVTDPKWRLDEAPNTENDRSVVTKYQKTKKKKKDRSMMTKDQTKDQRKRRKTKEKDHRPRDVAADV